MITADGHAWRPVRWWDATPRLDAHALRTHGWRLADVIASEPGTAYGGRGRGRVRACGRRRPRRGRPTSALSSLLMAAARGQEMPEAARTLRALAHDCDVDEVTTMARRLFAVGATSGHDLALGLAAALSSAAPVTAREAT